jgi:hypothetical protein
LRQFAGFTGIEVALQPFHVDAISQIPTVQLQEERLMSTTSNQPPRPNEDAEKKSPNYRAQQPPRGEEVPTAEKGDCHPVNPTAPPSSAAENHDAANQECEVDAPKPKTASTDQREKATG